MTFLAPFVEAAHPIDGLVSVIAHELAHCYRRGNGAWTADSEQEEHETRDVTREWGFGEPGPGDTSSWDAAIQRWRSQRAFEFGTFTESYWLHREQSRPVRT
jgi:hypothetical protein